MTARRLLSFLPTCLAVAIAGIAIAIGFVAGTLFELGRVVEGRR